MADYPSTPIFMSFNLVSNTPAFVSKAQSGKRQVRRFGAHLWSLTAKYSALTRDQFAPVYAFAVKQKGQYGTFTIVIPEMSSPLGVGTGTPLVSGAGQVGNTLTTSGWTPNTSSILKAGDIFNISNDTKVYMVTEDANSDGSGNATLTFEPDMVRTPADASALTVNDVEFTMEFAGPTQQYGANHPLLFTYEVSMIEALT